MQEVSLYAKAVSAAWVLVALMCLGFFGRDWISALRGEADLSVLVVSTVAVLIGVATLASAIATLRTPGTASINVLLFGAILAAVYGLAYLLLVGIEFGVAPAVVSVLLVVLAGVTLPLRRAWSLAPESGKSRPDTTTTR